MADPVERLAAPARRALASIGVTRLEEVPAHTKEEIASLHGMGPTAVAQLEEALFERGLSFDRTRP